MEKLITVNGSKVELVFFIKGPIMAYIMVDKVTINIPAIFILNGASPLKYGETRAFGSNDAGLGQGNGLI